MDRLEAGQVIRVAAIEEKDVDRPLNPFDGLFGVAHGDRDAATNGHAARYDAAFDGILPLVNLRRIFLMNYPWFSFTF